MRTRSAAPTHATPGYPDRTPDLDALPGFNHPPPGYGEVPFWWWSGDDLDVNRLLWQVRELHKKGISGVQVNYSHHDTPGWPTDALEPKVFTEPWWKVYSRVAEECGKLGMGIGLSTYTLDWPNGANNLFYDLFYSKPELNAIELVVGERVPGKTGFRFQVSGVGCFAARAFEAVNGVLQAGGIALTPMSADREITWVAPAGEWEVWTFRAVRREGTLNPLMSGAGDRVVQDFFQPFEDHNPGRTSRGLNYFFNDELKIGLGKHAWNVDFAEEFRKRKGYDLLAMLPAMWTDMGDITPKVRIDYADVRMSLMEERYFKPIHDWHASRGVLFGCDSGGRGTQPDEFGDYFRATRWYTAPGHDTPCGKADLIKGKVSSSIANLYRQPRVQLEGYHSLGWGATTAQIMEATCENYLYGCNLLSLHGLYYTTYGSHWEWAPPCYHFRMPYWAHMDTFLRYFERLSYLMSQGCHVCDVAVIYPVAPFEAEMNGAPASPRCATANRARDTAFDAGRKLMEAGIDFEFIDHESLARAVVEGNRLAVKEAGAAYRALIFPAMEAVRWSSLEKAAAFAEAGGKVLAVGTLPLASDHAGRNDAELTALNQRAFKPACRLASAEEAVESIRNGFVQDVRGLSRTVRTLHRKVGPRDVYMVMGAHRGEVVEFRACGRVELWDPWTGEVRPLRVVQENATGTQVELPLEHYEAQVVVFTPNRKHGNPPARVSDTIATRTLPHGGWHVSFIPALDNRYGDFRLPVTPENKIIGVEARRFAWARETAELAQTAMLPETDDSGWQTQLHGHGPQFYLLGPIPGTVDPAEMDAKLAALTRVDPAVPVTVGDRTFLWRPYEFSWRYGREGDPGHQGFHGLKGVVSDRFIRLGKVKDRGCGVTVLAPEESSRYYLWTSATVGEPVSATLHVSQATAADGPNASPVTAPSAVFIRGQRLRDLTQPVAIEAGANPVLIRYDDWGESHVVLRRHGTSAPEATQPLAMRWYKDPGRIPFDVYPGEPPAAEWFRFLSAPGTTAIHVQALSRDPVQAWFNGVPMNDRGNGRFEVQTPVGSAGVVALRLLPQPGHHGGAAIPEPIAVETGIDGVMPLGDWSNMGVLRNYSGGVRYRTTFTLTERGLNGRVELDLGYVVATAEVHLNGRKVGVRVAAPWRLDVTPYLNDGVNILEVVVYNTLANHYQTIPSLYRGDPKSGLLGPVRIVCFT